MSRFITFCLTLPLILSFNYTFSQDLDELYINDIPLQLKNKSNWELEFQPLLEYAKLNPELIYFCIKYIEAKFDSSLDDFFIKNLSKIYHYYEYLSDTWVKSLSEEIESGNMDEQLKDLCLSFLHSNFHNSEPVSIPEMYNKIEKNYLHYFVVKYYLNEKGMQYKHNEDYYVKRLTLEKEKLFLFNEMRNNPGNYSKDDLVELLSCWYIFSNPEIQSGNLPSEVIVKVLHEDYKFEYSYGYFALSLGGSYQRNIITLSGETYGTSFYSTDGTDYNFSSIPISISVNYKLAFYRYIESFSYINFQLNIGYASVNRLLKLDKIIYWRRNVDNVSNRSEIFDFSKNEIKISSIKFLSFNTSTPVFFMGKNFIINAGLGGMIFNSDYKISYNYYYRKFESNFGGPNILKSEKGTAVDKEGNTTSYLFYPLVLANYKFSKTISLLLGITMYEVSLCMGYDF